MAKFIFRKIVKKWSFFGQDSKNPNTSGPFLSILSSQNFFAPYSIMDGFTFFTYGTFCLGPAEGWVLRTLPSQGLVQGLCEGLDLGLRQA